MFDKWDNYFVDSLRKIQNKLYPKLTSDDDALIFIESLLLKLLNLITEKSPHNIQDLEKIANNILPKPINEYANKKAISIIHECTDGFHDSTNGSVSHSQTSNNSFTGSNTLSSGRRKKMLLVNISNSNSHTPNNTVILTNCPLIMGTIVERIQQSLIKEVLFYKIDTQTTIYLCALLEYIAADIFNLVCKYVENMGHQQISLQDVKIAMNADNLLMDLFFGKKEKTDNEENPFSLIDEFLIIENENGKKTSQNSVVTYDDVIKDLVFEEKQFQRDLNLILKVFREPFMRLLNKSNSIPNTPTTALSNSVLNNNTITTNSSNLLSISSNSTGDLSDASSNDTIISEKYIDSIFSNILDIYEFSVNFLGSLEDTLEMSKENEGIGVCFEEVAESLEFDVFEKFARDIYENSNPDGKAHDQIMKLFKDQQVVNCLSTGGQSVLLCIKYVLPKLLNGPVVHCMHYFDYIKLLINLTINNADHESLIQCEGLLNLLRKVIENVTCGKNLKLHEGYLKLTLSHRGKQTKNVMSKIKKIRNQIDGFDNCLGSDLAHYNQYCNEFIYEGVLSKARKGERKGLRHIGEMRGERYCFLFDGLMICCKPIQSVGGTNTFDYKFKEKFFIRKIEIFDSDETNAFEILYNTKGHEQKQSAIFIAKTQEEKNIWISNLLLLSQKSILERTLDSILAEEERKIPLKLPKPDQYKFSEKDSDSNILFDYSNGKKVIKAATLNKLIERLTYHQFVDPMFIKIFLTTYRSFCSPEQLLDLLIERFAIPFEEEISPDGHCERSREELKRFKKEYLEPIQFRVLNVLRHWIDAHFYDLDEKMITKLNDFLIIKVSNERKNMKKWVDSLLKMIKRKEDQNEEKKVKFISVPPPTEHWLTKELNQFNILTVHPLEFSRQLTLYEFDLYCAVKPFELIGSKWTKKDKNVQSPNLIRLAQHNSKMIYWFEKEIVECANFEERQAIMLRLAEMLQVLKELNNFNGIIEIISAIESASVHRLELTLNSLPAKYRRLINDLNELNERHFQKYQERLRSINPPCVPFFGLYLTQILYLEEGNPDYIDAGKDLINFSKRRKIAEIISEIQQYQNQPYCLLVYPELRQFIIDLNPLGELSEKEFQDYIYKKSLEIEPRGCKQPPKGERRFKEISLKSPGIKPSHQHSSTFSSNTSSSSKHLHTSGTYLQQNISINNIPSTPTNTNTPSHTPSSSTPTSPTLVSPKSPAVSCIDNSVFAPVFVSSSSLSSYNLVQHHQTQNNNPYFFKYNTNSSSMNFEDMPPPLPPRSNRQNSLSIHQRTNSESSTISPNTILNNSSLNTPLSANSNMFKFNFDNPAPPPPPPPRIPRLQENNNNITTVASSLSISSSTLINNNNLNSDSSKPPPLPPRGQNLSNNQLNLTRNFNCLQVSKRINK